MLLTEAIYNIREKLKQLVDDSGIDDREIIFELNNQRALFYRNQYNQRNRVIDEDIKQTISMALSETKEISDCETSMCYVLKSTLRIPDVIELHNKNAVLRAYGDIGMRPFSIVSWNQFQFAGRGDYGKKEVYISIKNGYVYVKSFNKLHRLMTNVYLDVILEDPTDIKDYCVSSDCYDQDTFEYPIKSYAYAYITPQIINAFIQKLQMPEDELNNSEDG